MHCAATTPENRRAGIFRKEVWLLLEAEIAEKLGNTDFAQACLKMAGQKEREMLECCAA